MKDIDKVLNQLESFPSNYKKELKKAVKYACEVFKDNLCNITLGGSGGKGNIIEGWSDLDIYIILYKYDVKQVIKYMNKIKNSTIHIGTTYYSLSEVKKNLIDVKTKVMCYEQQNYNVNPILYGENIFNKIDFKLIVDDNLSVLPDVVHDIRRRYINLVSNKDLCVDKSYIKKILVLVKCILRYYWIFSYGYKETIDKFYKLVDSTNYKLTEKCEFDIIDAINNMENSKESIIKFSSYLLDFITYMIEEGKEK